MCREQGYPSLFSKLGWRVHNNTTSLSVPKKPQTISPRSRRVLAYSYWIRLTTRNVLIGSDRSMDHILLPLLLLSCFLRRLPSEAQRNNNANNKLLIQFSLLFILYIFPDDSRGRRNPLTGRLWLPPFGDSALLLWMEKRKIATNQRIHTNTHTTRAALNGIPFFSSPTNLLNGRI